MSDKVDIVYRFATENGLQLSKDLSTNAYFEEVARQVNLSPQGLTNLLWDTYNPSGIWMVLLGIGLLAVVSLFIYDKVIPQKQK
jgi:hypothetical protein